ncbi:MAG: class I SAM-dependent methyltransferase [Myxococcales bacterium]|nr:class I SAM-dependent methyltransferase [Myxococcales bacterium]
MNQWDDRYAAGPLPWDTGAVCMHLRQHIEAAGVPDGRVLEIGCGTGTNAVYLASLGVDVVATDVSPRAVERARQRAAAAGVSIEFAVVDYLGEDAPGGPFAFVFDRGVWHVFDGAADRDRYAARVSRQLTVGGRWLSVSGSTEGPARETGPPRRSLRDIALAIEPHLELVEVARTRFSAEDDGAGQSAAWRCLAGRRDVAAQPSTLRE